MEYRGWHSRGYLPHFDGEFSVQFLTWRTHGNYPKSVLNKISESLQPEFPGELTSDEYAWDRSIDQCEIGRFLDDPQVSLIVANAIVNGSTLGHYDLFNWVIMPNHVHLLLRPMNGHTIPEIVKAIKSTSSRGVKRLLNLSTPCWAPDYFDRFIRNEEHFWRVAEYIEQNPVAAGLVRDPSEWYCSSRNYRCQL